MNRRILRLAAPTVVLLAGLGCETFETGYFKDKVNRATHQQVVNRYGAPHKTDRPSPDHEVWTYFDRGSSLGGYAGYGRPQPCAEYHLGFDNEGLLRDWEVVDCGR